jgi:multimeric flavodoxin WrbA
MKVLMVNGSPNEKRCTYTALAQVAEGLKDGGVASEIVWLGKDPVKPCIGCGACGKTQRCAFGAQDGVNELIEQAIAADGLVVGSPVYYAGINGSLKSTLDRMFFAAGSTFAHKPAGTVVSARRAGTTSALEQLNKYAIISQMLLVGSLYWPMVHGQSTEQVVQDEEGMQVTYTLGANMAWLLNCLEAGRAAGVATPSLPEHRTWTNFIR